MKNKLTILISLDANERVLQRLRNIDAKIEIRTGPWIQEAGQTMDPALLRGADVLLCELPPHNFNDFDCLKWIQLTSSGYTQVLDLPILERGIRVTNGLGNFDGPIAEWNMMMMLMWQRDMLDLLENQKNRIFDRDARFQRDIFDCTVGFWGYGGLARETARLAKALHMKIWALTRDGTIAPRHSTYCVEGSGDVEGRLPDRVFGPGQIKEFMEGLDFLVIGMSLTAATKGIIGEKELRMLKPSAVVINPSRAAIIQEKAFIQCLREKWIKGASLDVHYAYPLPPEHVLWSMPNLILTPHISGSAASPHFLMRIYDIFEKNIERFIHHQPFLNELTTAQLQGR